MISSSLRKEIDEALYGFVDRQRPLVLGISDDLTPLLTALDALLAGGKRLRPAFCYWGWRAAGGDDHAGAVRAAASLELLHASALIHDDVMDASDTRRGQPSAHRRFERMAAEAGWAGAPAFGVGAAILLGDLVLSWAGEMYDRSGLPAEALDRGRPVYDLMRTEVMCGQYLDLLEQARGARAGGTSQGGTGPGGTAGSVESALRVVEYKSAKYTVERPLHLGAALARAQPGDATCEALTAFGLPLGIAFQLRDDVLGVFGDPAETGKPAGDDLREGKRTVLVGETLRRAVPAQAATFQRLLGDPELTLDGVAELRSIMVDTGALAACEAMIDSYVAQARTALDSAPITLESKAPLSHLVTAATSRTG